MARQGINTGTTPNDGLGDSLLTGAIKINSNFSEIYSIFGDGNTLTSPSPSYWIQTSVGIHTLSNVGLGTTNPTSRLTVSGDALVSGISTFSSRIDLKQITETVTNNFNTTLSPSTGTLTIDTSLGSVVLGDLDASVTTWAFTNVPTTNGKATTITVIIDGDTAQTYGDACNVNGSAVSGGVKWSGGSAPTSTNNFDILSFTIVRDGSGTINVFGSSNTNFS